MYQLSCTLHGHEKDVRGLASLYHPRGAFVSVSRDLKSRVWVPKELNTEYNESIVFSGHENFVSCVCVLPPDNDHPQGIILTGSNDCFILAYSINSPSPLYKLEGHTNNVCALSAGKFGTFVSGSWDCTARVWFDKKTVMTLEGHQAAVWCVAILPVSGHIVTGSADKTIRLWKAGKQEQVFEGHADCVRSLAIMNPNHFLSSSNDTTVRMWDLSGSCLKVFTGHSNYVYALSCIGTNMEFVSCGEDRSLKVWSDGKCTQTIAHPAQSVWCVCALPNGDIATGASDGVIRIFTKDPQRVAAPEILAGYEELVAKSSIPAQIGDIKTDDLPGPDALHIPGSREGQTLMIRRKDTIEAYQWSELKTEWEKIGDVVGGQSTTNNEAMFEGKKFDYVFDVNISDGYPTLKLPYNLSDDPYVAAHNFLERNELSPLFINQVVEFIQQQTGTAALVDNQSYSDPYTGSSRYVAKTFSGNNEKKEVVKVNSFFPEKTFIKFEQVNVSGLVGKLKDFNNMVDVAVRAENEEIESLKNMLMEHDTNCEFICHVIFKMLEWPSDLLFPVLDSLRHSLLNESINKFMFSSSSPINLIQFFETIAKQLNSSKNQFLMLRCLCNSFQHEAGRSYMLKNTEALYNVLVFLKDSDDKNTQIALSSVYLNLSIAISTISSHESQFLSHLLDLFTCLKEEEAFFRSVIALGTFISADEISVVMAKSLGFDDIVRSHRCFKQTTLDKVKRCTESLLSKFH